VRQTFSNISYRSKLFETFQTTSPFIKNLSPPEFAFFLQTYIFNFRIFQNDPIFFAKFSKEFLINQQIRFSETPGLVTKICDAESLVAWRQPFVHQTIRSQPLNNEKFSK